MSGKKDTGYMAFTLLAGKHVEIEGKKVVREYNAKDASNNTVLSLSDLHEEFKGKFSEGEPATDKQLRDAGIAMGQATQKAA